MQAGSMISPGELTCAIHYLGETRMKKFGTLCAAIALAAGAASGASAADSLYGVTFGDGVAKPRLISIDATTGAGSVVGPLSGTKVFSFGLGGADGKLYGYNQSVDRIIRINPTTGATMSSFSSGFDIVGEGGLDIAPGGKGFLAGAVRGVQGDLYRFDAVAKTVSHIGLMDRVIDGLAQDSLGTLFGISQGVSDLYVIDTTTAAITLVGGTGVGGSGLGGLGFASDGTLYAIIADALYSIDKTTGVATLKGATGFSGVSGLAILPSGGVPPPVVPEPGAWAMLAASATGYLLYRRRR